MSTPSVSSGIIRASSWGSYVQSQSIEQTISVVARWRPVRMPAATPWLTACRTKTQFGRSPNIQ